MKKTYLGKNVLNSISKIADGGFSDAVNCVGDFVDEISPAGVARDGREEELERLVHIEVFEELLGGSLRHGRRVGEIEELDHDAADDVAEGAPTNRRVVSEDGLAEAFFAGED